ncbi:MAG: hypothetical protein GC146_11440 [Limimaricola sp.]|uniref:hypothetical protein n=1 Tax=Limimaricola sp. TaxID=2211665 RepID=UPI001D767524|nr:hypothetical protein [Limimaricola sp.]MBI1417827.1 hypothetical protein [Limimaricola sp.]
MTKVKTPPPCFHLVFDATVAIFPIAIGPPGNGTKSAGASPHSCPVAPPPCKASDVPVTGQLQQKGETMKTDKRWMTATIAAAEICEVQMPWSRGARRAALIAARRATEASRKPAGPGQRTLSPMTAPAAFAAQ